MLFADPQDVTVEVNQWAQFNCTASCGYTVSWYMAGHSRAIKRNNTVPGLLIKRGRASTCTESGERAFFFEVLATARHSISQHFTVLLMRHAIKRIAAVVEQGGDVTADLPSLQVSPFGMLCLHFVRFSKFTFRPPNFSKLAIDMTLY